MCIKTVNNYPHALKFASDCCMNQRMCDEAVDTHPPTIKYVPECYKTQEMYYREAHRCFFVFQSILDQYKTQEICDIAVSLYPFSIEYCPDKNITKKICEAVNDSLAAYKLIFDWFVTSKMIEKLCTALYTENGLLFFDEGSGDVTFRCDEMGILSVNLNNTNLDNNFNEDDLDTIIIIILLLSDFWLGISNLKNAKHLKKR